MKTILCDVDGVCADLMVEWLRLYNLGYNDDLTLEEITDWSIHKFTVPECGVKMYEYIIRPDIYNNVYPIPGAQEGVARLKEKYRVVFVTSGLQPAKIEWLSKWGFIESNWRFSKDFVIASDKSLIKGDFLIDDAAHNCEHFPGLSICFDSPWNHHYKGYRARNWDEILSWMSV